MSRRKMFRMPKPIVLALVIAALPFTLSGKAEDEGGLSLLWKRPAVAASEIVDAGATRYEIEKRKGVLLRLNRAARKVFITDPGIADVHLETPRLLYVYGKEVGETSLYALGEDDEILTSAVVAVTFDISHLQTMFDRMMPGAEIKPASLDGALVLTGYVPNAAQAEEAERMTSLVSGGRVINRLAIQGPNQVNLKVRIAEVSRNVMKEFGFRWESLIDAGDFMFGLGVGEDVLLDAAGFPLRSPLAGTNDFAVAGQSGRFSLAALISALEDEGLISVLAEPNLTAASGESARFLAGGEFPVPIAQEDGVISITFREFGVALAFLPQILDNGRINLRVEPEVSQLSSAGAVSVNGLSVPALTTRKAETTVELASGQSFAIAGLLQNSVTDNVSKLPGLADIPILGRLFRSDSFRRQETELVIIVTAYLVTPVSQARLSMPIDGLVSTTDGERLYDGSIYRQQMPPAREGPVAPEGAKPVGPMGFELD